MRFVNKEQVILGNSPEGWLESQVCARSRDRVVSTCCSTQLCQHFQVIAGTLLQTLGFQQLTWLRSS